MRNRRKSHRGGVLLLALILALNMLLPMEALAAPGGSLWIDDTEYYIYGVRQWNEAEDYLDITGITERDGYILWNDKYITLKGNRVLATDYIQFDSTSTKTEECSYYTTQYLLDFTAPESLSMKVTQGHSDLAIDPCVITNNGSEDLKLSQVEITAASGWTVVNTSTDFTTSESKNKIAFTAGSHDFANGASTPGERIAAGSNTTLQLAGKISEKADLTNATQVASMVLTVEKAAALISFTIDGTSCQAEEGMTWNEWCNSSYNTLGVYVCTANYVHTNDTHSLSSENGNKIILEAKNYSSVKEKCDCGA